MKQKYTKWIYFLAIAAGLQWAGCTESDESPELLNGETQSGSTDSRATEPVTATVVLTDTVRLETKLAETLGDAAPTVQKLTISGTFNAIDVEFLHTLTALESLDMTGVTVKYNNEHSNYSFNYSYVHPDGYKVEGSANQRLNDNAIGGKMFAGMTSLKEFKIPATINGIGDLAFEGCNSLEAISIPSNVKSIYHSPFNNSGLTTLTFEEGITSIPALGQCTRLKTVNLPSTLKEIRHDAFRHCPSLENITIPDGVVKIGSYAFSGCTQLKTVNLSSTLEEIGSNVFAGCNRLKTVNFPSTLNLKEIGSDVFTSCSSLESITIPDGVTKIGSSTFYNCTRLKTVNLPSTLKEIESSAFQCCSSLESITIPDGVVKIGSSAFYECSRLKTVNLPSTLKEIENYAFCNTPLATIEIPASVTTLGYGAFENCNQLRTVTIPGTVTQTEGFSFNYCSNLTAVFWNSEAEVGDSQGLSENCLLYLQTKNNSVPYWGPNWINVIVDGVAKSLELKYDVSWWGENNIFTCPQAFKAENISVTIQFDGEWTQQNSSSGWRTLALPFTPTHISHAEKGRLAPFGSDIEGAKPFWLRRLTQEGFTDVTSIEPNTPYIIAMPYNPEVYIDEYNISGTVTFEAKDVEIKATPDELPPDEGPDYYLQPTYRYVEANDGIYVLNRNWWIEGYNTGSVFTNTTSEGVYCYEAYVKPKPGTSTKSVYAIDTRSANTRSASQKNTTGIPAIGDM